MKILVTGGAGFVGSILVPMLLQKGHKVRVFDRLMYGIDPLLLHFLHPNFEFAKGDIRNPDVVGEATDGVDFIIHLAALVGFPICKKNEADAIMVNAGGTQTLINSASDKIPIIFASTGSCYGEVEGVCTEDTPLNPLTVYGESKETAENLVGTRDNFLIYRFATGYGVSPRLRLDLLINDFCYKAVRERNLIVYEKHFRRTFIHVTDMARAFVFGIENFDRMRNEVFNVGSENMNLTKEEIAEFIRKKADYYLHYADFGKDEDVRDYEVSYDRIKKLGFKSAVSLEEGVSSLIWLFQNFELEPQYSNV